VLAYPPHEVVQLDPLLLQGSLEQPQRGGLGQQPQAVEHGPGPRRDRRPLKHLHIGMSDHVVQEDRAVEPRMTPRPDQQDGSLVIDRHTPAPGSGRAGQHASGHGQMGGPIPYLRGQRQALRRDHPARDAAPPALLEASPDLVRRQSGCPRLLTGEEPTLTRSDPGQWVHGPPLSRSAPSAGRYPQPQFLEIAILRTNVESECTFVRPIAIFEAT
jgi:hypothetical protein